MPLYFLIKGLIIGFSIAAPVGPIGLLCIKRTLTQGKLIGFISGLGAASADAVYGLIAAFGLTFVSTFLIGYQSLLQLAGGLFLGYLGFITFTSKPSEKELLIESKGLMKSYASTFFLTLTNPMTILSFIAIFAALGIGASTGNYISSFLMVLGVFSGSAFWWFLLSAGTNLIRQKLDTKRLIFINMLSGIIILGFGLLSLWDCIQKLLI